MTAILITPPRPVIPSPLDVLKGIGSIIVGLFTSVGENLTTDLWDPATRGGVSTTWYIGSGTGTTAAAKGDTALVTAVASRVLATNTQPSADVNRHVATIPYSASFAITEAGLFDASSAGNMATRDVFSAINVTNGDSIQFTIDIETT